MNKLVDAICKYENETGIKVSHVLVKNANEISLKNISFTQENILQKNNCSNGYFAEVKGTPIYEDKTIDEEFIIVPSPSI